ncbi:HAMP domain-containing histidine kinase [Colwellia sp. MB02u-10]|uniref:sensor histidine kinase n=1 Tax=Colwellia sp. MB02u-10 TaxID=2759828 RepID=UPI0015F61DCF|nr:HAMP domain-containing sensor histidine kinase [Colwellia sp. MB02u-10]MBA6339495.1 HAMP domain-containing histidine kinase [Colwellia sp. MB02u-10]
MISIKKKLSRYISISISILLVSILMLTDLAVDTWISGEFDLAMINKAGLLTTLVSEDTHEIDFDFADEFMPEFSGVNDPEYFQLWLDNKVFERSKTLDLFDINQLPRVDLAGNSSSITDIVLPDGRSGRMYFAKFKPQIDSDVRESQGLTKAQFVKQQKPMELAYAISNEGVNQILWFVDIIFIFTSISAIIAVRFIVFNVVEHGLRPIEQLNIELKQINLNSTVSTIDTTNLPKELIAIAHGINHFISENKVLYAREKRVTSDIAHELKTPIAELLSLSEVAIKFPHEKQLTESFKTDVLTITERLRNIVNGILLLQKSTNNATLKKQQVNLEALLNSVIMREKKANRVVNVNFDQSCENVYTNEFALTTIMSNLINNALYYSPASSSVTVNVEPHSHNNQLMIKVSNLSKHDYAEKDLALFFEPLWQKDSSRTSAERYGLGLAIVKSYCESLSADLNVTMSAKKELTFTIILSTTAVV